MTEIRSYRRVFDLERRIYSVDRLRLNPAGVPLRGVVYLLATICTALAASSLPVLGRLVDVIPWYLRDLGVPAALAVLLGLLRIDGRPFHLALAAMIRHRLRPRSTCGLTRPTGTGEVWLPPPIVMLPDGSESRFRRLRYEGPGTALVLREHRRAGLAERERVGLGSRRAVLRLLPDGRRRMLKTGTIIALAPRVRLEVVADRASVARLGGAGERRER